MPTIYKAKDEQALMTEMWDPALADDLYRWVMFTFPWGERGTRLEKFKGPRTWQREELDRVTDHIRKNRELESLGLAPVIYRSATTSGRGVGKSSLTAWLNLWMMTTRRGSATVITANTETQLKTRTWAELGKWHTLAINSHWFDRSALTLKPAQWFEDGLKKELKVDTGYYYAQAQLWSEENPDGFAGLHNDAGVMVIFDEASGIPAPIWTVTKGFYTEPIVDRYWFVFSNPRRNTGAFFECFHEQRDSWLRRNLDSRTVEGTDRAYLQEIVDTHGEDSDEARIEVKGEFPRRGDKQFISRELIQDAVQRELEPDPYSPLIMGVDPARFGDDSTVIRFRQGRDARSIPPVKLKGKDNMEVVAEVGHWIDKVNPDAVCVDAGSGSGIIDRLRELKFKVHEIWFGAKAEDSQQWANKRTELWARMRDWLPGGCIPSDPDLKSDLAGPEYKYLGAGDRQALEPKEEMKKRGIPSPDNADALALTFAVKVARRDSRVTTHRASRQARDVDYDVLG